MSLGELSCRCSHSPSVLYIFVGHRRLGFLCEGCARHAPTLRSFLQAATWFYDWPFLTFAYAVTSSGFRDYLEIVVKQESERWRLGKIAKHAATHPNAEKHESL